MGRWRPPQAKSLPYITAHGFEALQAELKALWQRRKDVTKHLAAAAAEGDRSENAEYIYRKKELREIDRRIRYLQKRLPELQIVQQQPSNPQQIFFGALVTLEDHQGQQSVYHIVGADELDLHNNAISVDSPLAQALLKKHLDDEIEVTIPSGVQIYYIIAVKYTCTHD